MEPIDLPPVHGPRDLPALRRWIMRKYGSTADLGWMHDAGHIVHAARQAELWWIDPAACDLLAESAPTIPGDVRLDMNDLPTHTGLAFFATDLIGHDADPSAEGREVTISAMLWTPCWLPPEQPGGANRFGVSFLVFTMVDLGNTEHRMHELWEMMGITHLGSLFAYVGRTDWIAGWEAGRVLPDAPNAGEPLAEASMAEDRRLMMALWLLTRTPVARVTEHPLPRYMRRQAEREKVNPAVRVLALHGPIVGESPDSGSSGSRQYRVRWVVRAHWRWQAHGPGRLERKLILVPPHIKGSPDAPLIGGERVWKVAAPNTHERN